MIDIIVVSYNARENLERCLTSVHRHTEPGSYRITVVENSDSLNIDEKWSVRILHPGRNLGFAGGANLALAKTRAEMIAFLDDDLEVSAGWLPSLKHSLQSDRRVGMVGPKLVLPNGRLFAADLRYGPLRNPAIWQIDQGQFDFQKVADSLAGACWLVKREVFEKVGCFDEAFFPCQFEDSDFCVRARLAGYAIIYDGSVSAVHHNLFRSGGQNLINRTRFLTKWKTELASFPREDSAPSDIAMSNAIRALQRQEYANAAEQYAKIEQDDPRLAEPIVRAIADWGRGRMAEAESGFREILALNPQNSLARNYLLRILSARREEHYQSAMVLSDFVKRYSVQNEILKTFSQ